MPDKGKKLAGAVSIKMLTWGLGGKAPMLIAREALKIKSHW